MSWISHIRERVERVRGSKTTGTEKATRTDLPLDHQLSFNSDTGDTWQFDGNHIMRNGDDVEECIENPKSSVKEWQDVSAGIDQYKAHVFARAAARYARLVQVADRIQSRIMFHMKRIFDEKMSAVQLRWGDGAALLNNVNVRALMAMYHVRPTEKAKCYLNGLRAKLGLILSGAHASPAHARVKDLAQDLYDEITDSLSVSTIDHRCLPAPGGRRPI
ncbi:MAG: hypothetical protein COV45_09040 [Deltaproteobacteria bacterium CG11_big_fil_rev_8_21_14_0_20_47_16]|nr:MAG: hypothetical protein COV45_09040 [Deltaproteobacteria bacterium CG11_big_fil_rev_8_21_14_0_20_47_16]